MTTQALYRWVEAHPPGRQDTRPSTALSIPVAFAALHYTSLLTSGGGMKTGIPAGGGPHPPPMPPLDEAFLTGTHMNLLDHSACGRLGWLRGMIRPSSAPWPERPDTDASHRHRDGHSTSAHLSAPANRTAHATSQGRARAFQPPLVHRDRDVQAPSDWSRRFAPVPTPSTFRERAVSPLA